MAASGRCALTRPAVLSPMLSFPRSPAPGAEAVGPPCLAPGLLQGPGWGSAGQLRPLRWQGVQAPAFRRMCSARGSSGSFCFRLLFPPRRHGTSGKGTFCSWLAPETQIPADAPDPGRGAPSVTMPQATLSCVAAGVDEGEALSRVAAVPDRLPILSEPCSLVPGSPGPGPSKAPRTSPLWPPCRLAAALPPVEWGASELPGPGWALSSRGSTRPRHWTPDPCWNVMQKTGHPFCCLPVPTGGWGPWRAKAAVPLLGCPPGAARWAEQSRASWQTPSPAPRTPQMAPGSRGART